MQIETKNPSSLVRRKKRGLALITVVSLIATITVLIIAMLSLSDSERSSATRFSDTERARQLADSAVSLVMSQIWDGSGQDNATTGREIWASQPGAIRKYRNDGAFLRGYKLYSDPTMIVTTTEESMANDTPDTDWQEHPAMWTDLNTPVIRPAPIGASDPTPAAIFPIIDPRAYVATGADATNNVEGFTYIANDGVFPGVEAASSNTDLDARLPMPVQWLYLLQDGTLGTLTSGGGPSGNYTFQGAGGITATATNPIVGRIAFWTDDETSKININTASEPQFWTTPYLYHERDENWSVYQPTRFEYQRYPGHPATVALSTVLFPNEDLDPYGKAPNARSAILAKRERIYQIVPKVNLGGSISGTVPFWALTDSSYPGAKQHHVNITESLKQRLYASVDDLLFSQEVSGDQRLIHDDAEGATPENRLFGDNPERALERVRAFLTAHSRSPETNLFGLPRIAAWPVADESLGNTYRTIYDNMIAWCASSGNATSTDKSYFFRRKNSLSATEDINLPRNRILLEYLYHLLGRDYPNGGAPATASFTDKYGSDAARLAVQMFDYIRSINVYDGSLAPSTETLKTDPTYRLDGKNGEQILNAIPLHKTFTADRGSQPRGGERIIDRAFPGHGMVAPSQTTLGGVPARGQGRFVAISEVGLLFICTADGTNDEGSYRIRNADGSIPPAPPIDNTNPSSNSDPNASGGRTAPKILHANIGDPVEIELGPDPHSSPPSQPQYWYSNYPPLSATSSGRYGTNPGADEDDPRSMATHPGYQPKNWNATLVPDTPLEPGERRVQGMLMVEFTNLAPGWGGMMPNLCIEVIGLDGVRIRNTIAGDVPLYASSIAPIWRSGGSMWAANNVHMIGGSVSPTVGLSGRRLPPRGGVLKDPAYHETAETSPNKAYLNFDLVTDFHTIPGPLKPTPDNPHQIVLGGDPITINIYTGQNPEPANLVQSVQVDLRIDKNGNISADKPIPTPELVRLGTGRQTNASSTTTPRVDAPHWWAFHFAGALNRFSGAWTNPTPYTRAYSGISDANDESLRTLGRLYHSIDNSGATNNIPRYQQVMWMAPNNTSTTDAYVNVMRPYATQTTGSSTPFLPAGVTGPFGQDTLVNLVPRHGDLRLHNAKFIVPASDWRPHPRLLAMDDPNWLNPNNANLPFFVAHTWSRYGNYIDPGFSVEVDPVTGRNLTDRRNRLIKNVPNGGYWPDVPIGGALAHRYRDFDNPFGAGNMRDGPWINWPDEGNIGIDNRTISGATYRMPGGYHGEPWRSAAAGFNYMTPNRLMPSAVMFGSLPPSPTLGGPDGNGDPWRTLLFRPNHIRSGITSQIDAQPHPGAPSYFGGVDPADHLLLDLFWMPIVEPYAISEPYSTAGKVNLNYQMVPFNKYIRRATGLHAVLKGEMMHAIPTDAAPVQRGGPTGTQLLAFNNSYGDGQYHHHQLWTDIEANLGNYTASPKFRHWHRTILADQKVGTIWQGTLGQFERRFEFGSAASGGTTVNTPTAARGLFRTASQIAEINLIPKKVSGTSPSVLTTATNPAQTEGGDPDVNTPYNDTEDMKTFWEARALTGDNARERPYAHIYQKITTQSNTYRVHYRAQTIRKARSVPANEFNPQLESINADYRGSALIERRINPDDPTIPDYALPSNYDAEPLDRHYKFRVLENKRFAP